MGQVIHVDFTKKNTGEQEVLTYLESLREMGVDEDDVLEVFDAINDLNCFMDSDHDIQVFARGYLERYM